MGHIRQLIATAQLAVNLSQESLAIIEAARGQIDAEVQLRTEKVAGGGLAVEEPGIGRPSEKSGVLAGPDRAVRIENMVRETDSGGQGTGATVQVLGHGRRGGPIVGRSGLGVFD